MSRAGKSVSNVQLVLSSLVGVLLIALAARDIFQTLFQPAGRGRVSAQFTHAALATLSRLGRRWPSLLPRVGPLLTIATAAYWVLLLVFGWALLLWPHLPESFLLASGLEPSEEDDFVDALYLSLVTLTTLGYGDMTPREEWLRIVASLEGVVGFAVHFHSPDARASLARFLPSLLALTEEIEKSGSPGVRFHNRALGMALDDLGSLLSERFLGGG